MKKIYRITINDIEEEAVVMNNFERNTVYVIVVIIGVVCGLFALYGIHVSDTNIHKHKIPYSESIIIGGAILTYDCSVEILCEDGVDVQKYHYLFSCSQVIYGCLHLESVNNLLRCSGEGKVCIVKGDRYG